MDDESHKDRCRADGCSECVMFWGAVTGYISWCYKHRDRYNPEARSVLLVSAVCRQHDREEAQP